jgi:hypothetical protein
MHQINLRGDSCSNRMQSESMSSRRERSDEILGYLHPPVHCSFLQRVVPDYRLVLRPRTTGKGRHGDNPPRDIRGYRHEHRRRVAAVDVPQVA